MENSKIIDEFYELDNDLPLSSNYTKHLVISNLMIVKELKEINQKLELIIANKK